ncbi:hypothetical protein C2S52_022890 [Perilla frutescens var. hirtella]|nr:hypothetical protein C2S52_022890 [Perilla frutescens var. hirtella]
MAKLQLQKKLKTTQTMADAVVQPATQSYALITGANKGIGFEICRQLASKGIVVILASRDEKRGIEAQQRLKEFGNYVVFHQLDVVDPASVAAAAEFIKTKFGRLDILVNNAGILGAEVDGDVLVLHEHLEAEVASFEAGGQTKEPFYPKASGRLIETLKGAEECIQTNLYGVKTVTEALIPLLQLSHSPRIVNVSSVLGSLVFQRNEWAKGVLSREDEGLTEDEVDEVVHAFLKISSMVYWKKSSGLLTLQPTKTDITCNSGPLSEAEGAEAPVKLALLPDGGPSGSFFYRNQALSL